jgi:hypothetical protein
MSNILFHNKYHLTNHHTVSTYGYPDSGTDPLGAKDQEFLGTFYNVFENYTNAYSPKIIFYCFGFGIWKIEKRFKVNFFNVKLPDLEIKELPLKIDTKFKTKKNLVRFEINKRIFSKTFFRKNNFSIKNKEFKFTAYNDYE